jgi:mannose-6-phosphate isomerase class I
MFNKRPLNTVRNRDIGQLADHYASLAETIQKVAEEGGQEVFFLALDGTHGVPFQKAIQEMLPLFQKSGFTVDVFSTYSFVKTGEELRIQFQDNITENRAFGYVIDDAQIDAYFRQNAKVELESIIQEQLATRKSASKRMVVVFGPGADWIRENQYDLKLFLDISREKQQIKHKEEQLLNFGMSWNIDAVEKYKIAFFVEWPILENYRKQQFSSFDYYVDMNEEEVPVFAKVSDLVKMIQDVSKYPFRVKPFFAPGIWGGQYLKKLAHLPEEWVNCAWSFEPIAPENSILIEHRSRVIEVPFLLVMAQSHLEIMGERIARLFGDYFPIRFDYLDTMDGDNLSCQVHPKQKFLRSHFNEFLEQQESYYVMECKDQAKVYLGLTEDCDGEEFLQEVNKSQITGEPIEFTKYVQEWESKKGDLFLIPTGTVHCSGKDNMVLEISATTWWFTFKIYDYVRKDLDGKPRPINIDFAEPNIEFDRKKSWVANNLIQEPRLLNKEGDNEEYVIGSRDDLLFYVNRIHLKDVYTDHTNGEFLLINLVEGERIRVVSTEDEAVYVELGYAESYTLPSVFGAFKIVNIGNSPCKIIKAGVSKDWNVNLFE